jgi:hypothetical protein
MLSIILRPVAWWGALPSRMALWRNGGSHGLHPACTGATRLRSSRKGSCHHPALTLPTHSSYTSGRFLQSCWPVPLHITPAEPINFPVTVCNWNACMFVPTILANWDTLIWRSACAQHNLIFRWHALLFVVWCAVLGTPLGPLHPPPMDPLLSASMWMPLSAILARL